MSLCDHRGGSNTFALYRAFTRHTARSLCAWLTVPSRPSQSRRLGRKNMNPNGEFRLELRVHCERISASILLMAMFFMNQKRRARYAYLVCSWFSKISNALPVLSIGFISLATATFVSGQAVTPETATDSATAPKGINESLYATVEPLLEKNAGQLTPELRTAYLNWAVSVVLTQLRQNNQTVPEDCLAEVWADSDLRTAVYCAVFPPDPSILQNYTQLRAELGKAFIEKYRSLVIAFAVANRISRTETNEDLEVVPAGLGKDTALKPAKTANEKSFISGIADFMKTNRVSALDLYQDEALQEQLAVFLTARGAAPSLIAEIKQSVSFGEKLKNAMVLLGQRPAAREPAPDTITWLRYLISIYEATPSSTPELKGEPMSWPLIPIAQAPWPLLMPLAHPVPLGEARYIWERFQDANSPDRFHTYGPYRSPAKAMPYELQPSTWFWSAWPDQILHGGECIPISKATVELYCSLGKPAGYAGQPGHADLISYEFVDGSWRAQIEQAFAGGPDVTYAKWYFYDEPGANLRFRKLYNWAGAEYPLGLALGMNDSLQSYLDTRMVVNIFNALPPEEQRTIGKNLLQHGLETNPFNPDIWYRMAQLMPDPVHGMGLVQSVMNEPPDGTGYWKTVEEFVARYSILAQNAPQTEPELTQICAFLKTVPGIKQEDIDSYSAKH